MYELLNMTGLCSLGAQYIIFGMGHLFAMLFFFTTSEQLCKLYYTLLTLYLYFLLDN
jgi:hypothetical protein